ncbi:hypothetical protein [Actinocrispum wychmicini]|uniref:hypothetical protein n=1 Tax=Actinocrispum wychmicini TaxID=1213861 RepID=UPI0010504616|nr:hypothetical protein [Actinocrispum wychmicini]
MARSGPARDAGARLRRVVLRFLALAGFTALGWLAAVLLAGAASADTGVPQTNVNAVQPHSSPTKKPARNGGNPGLVGGLVGGVLNTVDTTVGNVTTTVTNTVGAVTTTVTNTVGAVTTTVTNTVGAVTDALHQVITTVTDLPQHILPGGGQSGGGITLPPLVQDPVNDLLKPSAPKASKTTATEQPTARVEALAPVAETVAETPAPELTLVAEPQHSHSLRVASPDTGHSDVHKANRAHERAAPGGNGPSPLPSPSGPMAPAAPGPSFSSGNSSGSGARGALAAVTPQARLAPPPLVGRLDRAHPVAERGHTPGLPVTTPD